MTAAAPIAFAQEAVDACVDRIAASRHFARSPRLRRFLRFTIQEMLEGRPDTLKERTIGVEVYGRPLGYDPRTDPIVRSEAHRLRSRLDAYYVREGAADPIVIRYPKGQYVPELRPSSAAPPQVAQACRLIVPEFEDRSTDGLDSDRTWARAIAEALRTGLEGWPGVQVLDGSPETPGTGLDREHLDADFRVVGVVERGDRSCAVAVRLIRLADEKEIWADTQRLSSKQAGKKAGPLAADFAASIGATVGRSAQPPAGTGGRAHDLYVKGRHSAIQYGNTLHPRHLEQARTRLERALTLEPHYVDALAELANLELQCLYPPLAEASLLIARARALLERALATDPRHARSLYLLGHAEGSALRPREALRLTESAVAIDPDDPEGRTMLAVRYTSLGFWESAAVACDWARALDPVWDSPARIKAYVLTRMGRLGATRDAIDDLVRGGTSPTEVAMARFDLRVAEGDIAGALETLSDLESTFPVRPDQEPRREIATALAKALQERLEDARSQLDAHRIDGPRFWDHAIRLALALGEHDLALDLFQCNPINRSYRWLASEPLVRPHLHRPGWRALADELHADWLRDLAEVGPRLPAPPPALPSPADLLSRLRGTASRTAPGSPESR